MQILFGITLFVSATLLFFVQPMFAKMALPLLGGSPGVWNTCMVFYQAALLGGYVYAHLCTRWLGARRHTLLHLPLMLLPWLVLPIGIAGTWRPTGDQNPTTWLLLLLAASVGLPFFVVSASAPMLQAWFARTGDRNAGDPYFLYAASNLGSMLALIGYPVVIEPYFSLAAQSLAWSAGFGLLTLLTVCCALVVWRAGRQADSNPAAFEELPVAATEFQTPSSWTRLRWLALSFAPSSLLLGVTTHLATDVASAPLLWVIPLSVYLLTFVLVFARRPLIAHRTVLRWQPLVVLPLAAWFLLNSPQMTWLIVPLHLGAFFATAMVCHGELAATRPHARYLTEFYLWMSLGGVLGGLFNAVVAPHLFQTVIEYPLMIVVACMLRPSTGSARAGWRARLADLAAPALLGAVMIAIPLAVRATGSEITLLLGGLALAVACVVTLSFVDRPIRFGMGMAWILVAGQFFAAPDGRTLHVERSFFGVLRVRDNPAYNANVLLHGFTTHGIQSRNPARRDVPLSYYHPTGPIGQVFAALGQSPEFSRVGVIGLGTGSIASYGRPEQQFTFYEIDPAVERIARDTRWFTFLSHSQAAVDVVLGDARLRLAEAPDGCYDLLVLDAFSSDSIPIHLMSREAFALYLDKLAPNGVLALHISNRYLRLAPIVGRLANSVGLVAREQFDQKATKEEQLEGKIASHWVVLARQTSSIQFAMADERWQPIDVPPGTPLWTDNFSNFLSVLNWRRDTGEKSASLPATESPEASRCPAEAMAGR